MSEMPDHRNSYGIASRRLVVMAWIAAAITFAIAAMYPSTRNAIDATTKLSFGAAYGFVAAESFLLTIPGTVVGLLVARIMPRTGLVLGSVMVLAVPMIVFCDAITFTWIGERFLSQTMTRISTTLAPALALHVTRSTVIDAIVAIGVGAIGVGVAWWFSALMARRWAGSPNPAGPWSVLAVSTIVAMLMAGPAAWHASRTVSEMREVSARHPFCAFHLVGYKGVGVHVPTGESATLARLRGLQAAPFVQAKDRRQLAVKLDPQAVPSTERLSQMPDVVVIVAESMRPELIDPQIMPNLAAFADKAIHCRQHFSGGNSTSYGVFTMLNGLEAIWFDRPVWRQPILNRLFHQAGYELGFFGGEDDWREFYMDGFIHADHFDRFEIEYPELLDSDYRAVQRNVDFLSRKQDSDATHRPRLGITYLLATHCRYYSEKEDQIFQPAAVEWFVIPYSTAMTEQIYNRYKNSARTLDRMIKPLLREDRIVIFMGDHGESFLEDGSAIHGLRLSKYQNMTPLIIYYPGVEPRTIESPTVHADILPTLLSILQLPVTDPDVFDGIDLTSADDRDLAQRVFSTSNFMERTVGLIGPWTSDPDRPFAYRFNLNIGDWQIEYLNPIDERGYECEDVVAAGELDGRQQFRRWVASQIGEEVLHEDESEETLFTRFFNSPDRETRLSVLKIANDIGEPSRYLYDLIAQAARDPDPEIRQLAKEIVIRTERHVGHQE